MNKNSTLVEEKQHLPQRLHHFGFVVQDQEVNRHFMENVLGIPLVATWAEVVHNPELKREIEFCHTFYQIGDGSALAFFQFADSDFYDLCKAQQPPVITRFDHIGFKVDSIGFEKILDKIKIVNYPHRILEHGYCKSLYVKSPDGLELEFALDPEGIEAVMKEKKRTAHQDLKEWLSGNRASNNFFKH